MILCSCCFGISVKDDALMNINTADYIPIISTIVNIADLFFKSSFPIVPRIHRTHDIYLYEKSVARCILASVPILGNIIVYILDSLNPYQNYALALQAVEKDGLNLQYIKEEWRNDPSIVEAAIEQNGMAFEFVGGEMRQAYWFDKAIQNNPMAYQFYDTNKLIQQKIDLDWLQEPGLVNNVMEFVGDQNFRAYDHTGSSTLRKNGRVQS